MLSFPCHQIKLLVWSSRKPCPTLGSCHLEFGHSEQQKYDRIVVHKHTTSTHTLGSGNYMKPYRKGQIQLYKHLSPSAQQALATNSGTLISLSQICDDECIALFKK